MKRESNASPAAELLAAEAMNRHSIEADKAQGAFDTFKTTQEEIINNPNGGAGFFAEAHHAASSGSTRIGSNEFGSADIENGDGAFFNPKYYSSAEDSYKAGAEIIRDASTGLEHAKYVGQTIIVPSDQIDHVSALHNQSIQQALAQGNTAHAEALQSISFSDHVVNGSFTSTPLSYDESIQGKQAFIDGHTPDYAYETGIFGHLESLLEGIGIAAAFTLFLSITPSVIREIKLTFNGEATAESLSSRLSETLKSDKVYQDLKNTSGKSALAALLSMSDYIDGIGAGFIVSTGLEAYKLSAQWKNNEIADQDFFDAFKSLVIKNGSWSIFALILFSLSGAGTAFITLLLTKLASNKLLESDRLNKEIEAGWADAHEKSFQATKTQVEILYASSETVSAIDETIESIEDEISNENNLTDFFNKKLKPNNDEEKPKGKGEILDA